MRIGQNPAKFVKHVPSPERVTAVVITYIPFLSGYYEQSLDVLRACLSSMRAHTEAPFDLLVFDNASCGEVRAYLQDEHAAGRIQYLVLSQENLGKVGAWNFAFSAAPGELIAFADADVYFEKGWLENLVHVMDVFPQAGMVTGMPLWSPEEFSTATVSWAEKTPGVRLSRGRHLPWEDYWKHARSLGQSETEARSQFAREEDLLIEVSQSSSTEERYFIGAGHFQFMTRKTAIAGLLPLPAEKPMGQVRRLDIAMNDSGFLRLSTPDWWVRHLGNTLQGLDSAPAVSAPAKNPRLKGPLRAIVHWIYHRTFDLLYKS